MSDIPIPADVVAQLSTLGATFFIHGILIVVPRDADTKALAAAGDLIDGLWNQAYTAETSDCGGT